MLERPFLRRVSQKKAGEERLKLRVSQKKAGEERLKLSDFMYKILEKTQLYNDTS